MVIQPNEELPALNQNCVNENLPLVTHFNNFNEASFQNVELLQSSEQPRHLINVLDNPIQATQFTEPINIINIQEQPVQTEQPKEMVSIRV